MIRGGLWWYGLTPKKQPKHMNEVTYSNLQSNQQVIKDGHYYGVRYVIVAGGWHPCAYVQCDEEFLDKHRGNYDDLDCITVHGGVTWTGAVNKIYALQDYEGVWFGWDYGHAGDWSGVYTETKNIMFGGTKHSLEEIEEACRSAIDQYVRVRCEDLGENSGETTLTKEILKNLGFTSGYSGQMCGDETRLRIQGEDPSGKKWKITIDLKAPDQSYAYNQIAKKRYEGSIPTVEDLREVVSLCKIPIKV